MPTTPKVSVRLSTTQRRMLKRLSDKLQLDQANVIRLAITRLAEAEGVLQTEKK